MSAIRLPTKLMDVTSSMSKNYEFGGGRIWPLLEEFKLSKPLSFLFYLYRASLISVSREFVKDVNKVIFDFIWRARTKSNTLLLLVTWRWGTLEAPHLDSIIETQRVLCCKKLATDQPSDWKNKISCIIVNLLGVNSSYVAILIWRNCL